MSDQVATPEEPVDDATQSVPCCGLDSFADIPYGIDVKVGTAVRTIGEILDLAPGDTIKLDREAHENLLLRVGGTVIGEAELVAADSGTNLQVTQIGAEE